MHHERPRQIVSRAGSALLLGVVLAGCSSAPPIIERPTPVEVPAEPAPLEPATPMAELPPSPAVKAPPPPPPPPIGIVVSSDIEAYAAVADALRLRLGEDRSRVFDLGGDASASARVHEAMASSGIRRYVAVGHLAATAEDLSSAIFCQVLNYEPDGLLEKAAGGVKLLPPFELQLERWQALSPALQSIGVVTGPGQDALLAEIRQAVVDAGLQFHARIARSDKEALNAFKRLVPTIDGFWMLPDHRILSPGVIREIMAYGTKHQKQIVVFNDKLLPLGALMSMTSEPDDVANQVIGLLARTTAGAEPEMAPLTRVRVKLNPNVASNFNAAPSASLSELAQRR